MFRSAENLRLAADMRALQRVAAPWRSARTTWFDGTPESLEARLAATERVLTYARGGMTAAHLELGREAEAARTELLAAKHRLLVDFLDDGARAFKGSKRVAGTSRNAPGGMNERQRGRDLDDTARSHFDEWYHGQPSDNFRGARGGDVLEMFHDHAREHNPDYDALFGDDAQRDALHDHLVGRFGSTRVAGEYPLGPGYDRPGFGPDDLAEYEDHLHEHGYHTDSEDLNALVHKLRPGLDDDDPARYSSTRVAERNEDFREDVESLKRSLRPDFSEDPGDYLFGHGHLNNDGTPRTDDPARHSSRRTANDRPLIPFESDDEAQYHTECPHCDYDMDAEDDVCPVCDKGRNDVPDEFAWMSGHTHPGPNPYSRDPYAQGR